MDIGISGYELGMGWLAQLLNAKYAQFSVDVLSENFTLASIKPILNDIADSGCTPILDARSTMKRLVEIVTSHKDKEAWEQGVQNFISATSYILSDNPDIKYLEVWGNTDIPVIMGGRGPQFDASTILASVYDTIHFEFPEVKVLTGGYGINADSSFLEWGLVERASQNFDMFNMHPLPLPCETLDLNLDAYNFRIGLIRKVLQDKCNNQPACASAFGIPTVDGSPPPELNYGTHWQLPGGIRAIDYKDAAQWYKGFLQIFEEQNFKFTCLIARDVYTNGLYRSWQDACGLLTPDGKIKSFVPEFSEWTQERQPFIMEDETIWDE